MEEQLGHPSREDAFKEVYEGLREYFGEDVSIEERDHWGERCIQIVTERDPVYPHNPMRVVDIKPGPELTWLLSFYGEALGSLVTLRYDARDALVTMTWRRSAWPHSVARAIGDLIEIQGIYKPRVEA